MAQHVALRRDTGLGVYFGELHSPWQGDSNENLSGLLRQYFPEGTDLCRYEAKELAAVANALNIGLERQ